MPTPCPLGEEIWLRRDHTHRGGAFFFREFIIASTLFVQVITLLILIPTIILLYQTRDLPIQIAVSLLAIVFAVSHILSVAILARYVFCASRYCPTWFYAEMINLEQIKIYYLFHKPTIIALSTLSLDSETQFRHYTTLKIIPKNSNKSVTLRLLTPEEHRRFMKYWQAANS